MDSCEQLSVCGDDTSPSMLRLELETVPELCVHLFVPDPEKREIEFCFRGEIAASLLHSFCFGEVPTFLIDVLEMSKICLFCQMLRNAETTLKLSTLLVYVSKVYVAKASITPSNMRSFLEMGAVLHTSRFVNDEKLHIMVSAQTIFLLFFPQSHFETIAGALSPSCLVRRLLLLISPSLESLVEAYFSEIYMMVAQAGTGLRSSFYHASPPAVLAKGLRSVTC
uniref:Uncharacterized protein n=1 Tax=Ascaris lumbricoides TaxID=6252 RepID=A0A0M3HZ72_ASCLU